MPFALDLVRRQFPVWFALLAIVGCQGVREEPQLLVVADVSPTQVELGDRLEVVGDGFPDGRRATVQLTGLVYRAGDSQVRGYEQSFMARSAGRNTVTVVPTEAQLTELVGIGEDARHATFRGEVRLAFSSHQANTGPVYGRLSDVVIDVFPWSVPELVHQQRHEEARRFAEFLGLSFAAPGDFDVVLVKPGGRAERAGVRGGDRLLSLDGLRLRAPADFSASGASTRAVLSLRRGRLQDPIELPLDIAGFRPVSARNLAGATLLVGFAAALLLLSGAPLFRVFTWLERCLVQRYFELCQSRAEATRLKAAHLEGVFSRALLPQGVFGAVFRPIPYLVVLGTSAAFAWLGAEKTLVGPDLDVPILFLLAALGTLTGACLFGGFRESARWSLGAGLKSAAGALLFHVPAGLSLLCVFVHAGTLRPAEVVADQGLLPWRYNLFQSPMLLAAFVVLMASCLPDSSRRAFGVKNLDDPSDQERSEHPTARSLAFIAELTHVLVISGLATVLFLGGWSLSIAPSSTPVEGSFGLLAGAVLLQLKLLGVVLVVFGSKWVLRRVTRQDLLGIWFRWLLPISIGASALSVVYQRGIVHYALLREAQEGVSSIVFSLVLCLLLYFAMRLTRAVRGGTLKLSAYSLNPWL
jgi:NADH-quinone oxidoreductase subunit H